MQSFIHHIADEFNLKRVPIIRPEEKDAKDLWKTIEERKKITNPKEFFNCGLSEKSLSHMKEFCKDACDFMQKCVQSFDYDGIN